MLARILLLIAPFFVVKYIIAPKSSYNMTSRDGSGPQVISSSESSAPTGESINNPKGMFSTSSVGLDVGIITENANEPIVGHAYLATGIESTRLARGQSTQIVQDRREGPADVETLPLKEVFGHVGDELFVAGDNIRMFLPLYMAHVRFFSTLQSIANSLRTSAVKVLIIVGNVLGERPTQSPEFMDPLSGFLLNVTPQALLDIIDVTNDRGARPGIQVLPVGQTMYNDRFTLIRDRGNVTQFDFPAGTYTECLRTSHVRTCRMLFQEYTECWNEKREDGDTVATPVVSPPASDFISPSDSLSQT